MKLNLSKQGERMKPQDVKDYYVTWAHAMRSLGLGITTYQHWVKMGYISIKAQRNIHKITKGKLKSDS